MRVYIAMGVVVASFTCATPAISQESVSVNHIGVADLKMYSPWLTDLRRLAATGDPSHLGKSATEFVHELKIIFNRGQAKAKAADEQRKKNPPPLIGENIPEVKADPDVDFYRLFTLLGTVC